MKKKKRRGVKPRRKEKKMKNFKKMATSVAERMATEFAEYYFANGNVRKMRRKAFEAAWATSPLREKFAELCRVATKSGDWERNGEFNRFFQRALKEALKKAKV